MTMSEGEEGNRDTEMNIPITVREQKVHVLKTDAPLWEHVASGRKNFDVRRGDRDFCEGDIVVLEEWAAGKFTGQLCKRMITYVLYGGRYGLRLGYVVLGLKEAL